MKRQKIVLFLGTLTFALLIALVWFVYQTLKDTVEPTAPTLQPTDNRQIAPDFTVIDTNGNAVRLSDYIGKPVVLNFWASWCGPCKNEMPSFDVVYRELGTEIHFLMVNLTDGKRETQKSAKAFIAENAYTFPIFYDTQQQAALAYSVTSIPATYFIDKDGNIVTAKAGTLTEAMLRDRIALIR